METANVIALASLVQHCAVAHAWTNTIIITVMILTGLCLAMLKQTLGE